MSVKIKFPKTQYMVTGILPAKPTKGDTYWLNGKPYTVVNIECFLKETQNGDIECDPEMVITVI